MRRVLIAAFLLGLCVVATAQTPGGLGSPIGLVPDSDTIIVGTVQEMIFVEDHNKEMRDKDLATPDKKHLIEEVRIASKRK